MDNDLSDAHANLKFSLSIYDWDWPGAEREFQRALELNPNNPEARPTYSQLLLAAGKSRRSGF